MTNLDGLLQRLEELITEIDALEGRERDRAFELLDGIDSLHRMALTRIAEELDDATLERLHRDPAAAWLLEAYGIGVDARAAAEAALESIRPYIHSHGGKVDVLEARAGIVRVRMSGACAGCTASSITLQRGIEEALRDGYAGFRTIEVEEEHADPHPPPGPTLLQIDPPSGTAGH